MNRAGELRALLSRRIVVLDGAMGTMIQARRLGEADFRGARFADHPRDLRGDNDLLNLTRPDVVREIHREYLAAGADVIETNTFNANAISQSDYGLADLAGEISREGARLARETADAFETENAGRRCFVAGSLGPTNRTLSLAVDVANPAFREKTFSEFVAAYREQAAGLLAGGADLLLVETVFDTLVAKAALFAIEEALAGAGRRVPVIVSGTITDRSGRTLSGQLVEAFWNSVSHADLLAVGINCALGAREMRPYIDELSRIAPVFVSAYPNAGLPNAFGGFDQTPEIIAAELSEFARNGWVNIVGGCCGTTPDHIRAIAAAVAPHAPRVPPSPEPYLRLSGLDPLTVRPDSNFIVIGERTNVTGSPRFAELVRAGRFEEAVGVARQQAARGANLLDVNMDEGMLDSVAAMRAFLNLISAEPEVARLPIMIDSSRWEVLEAGLQCLQGKGVVNSLSLKEGEEVFRRRAELVRRYGAALVVMAFDEEGQATTTERRVAICERAYRILTEEVGFPPQDIIFDPNVLTVATGIEEHDRYGVSFLEAVRLLKERLPLTHVSGGISNVSFSFRGNSSVREAMHAIFLYHAIRAGLDMGIVNAGQLAVYDDVAPELRERIEDVLLCRRPDATERLLAFAETVSRGPREAAASPAWRAGTVRERLVHALVHGAAEFVEADVDEALREIDDPLAIIEGPLMEGMTVVGDRFGAGKMFLPQVVKSARVMKKAVARLEPLLAVGKAGARRSAGRVVLATVKGDVHDIGKNIVAAVLACNNYEVIDLGVMVPCERILESARRERADLVGLSGLITPSLDEMVHVAGEMSRLGIAVPLLIGGATTSAAHTAVKIAPERAEPVVHVADASRGVTTAGALLSGGREEFLAANRSAQEELRRRHRAPEARPLLTLARARENRLRLEWRAEDVPVPRFVGVRELDRYPLAEIAEYIDWTPFFHVWELRGVYPRILDDPRVGARAREVFGDAREMLGRIVAGRLLTARAAYGLFPAASRGDDIEIYEDERRERVRAVVHTLRQQMERPAGEPNLALADFVAPREAALADHVGAFVVSAGFGADELCARLEREHDDYSAILVKALADRLAEAFAELLHRRVRAEWGHPDPEPLDPAALHAERYRGIRPAPGYPACPDHSEKRTLFSLLGATGRIGVRLTETGAMWPAAAVAGFYLAHPRARYFAVARIGEDQLVDYAGRKGISVAEARRWLAPVLAEGSPPPGEILLCKSGGSP